MRKCRYGRGAVPDPQHAAGTEVTATAKNLVAGRPWDYVENVSRPTMTAYSLRERIRGLRSSCFLEGLSDSGHRTGRHGGLRLQAEDDPVDSVNHSLAYYVALKKAGEFWRNTA